jgi:hypothetical protein
MLILRLVNVKSILESPHSLPKTALTERSYCLIRLYLKVKYQLESFESLWVVSS